MIYATLADVRAYGLTEAAADDARVTADLELASILIDNYCPPGFAAATTKTVTVLDVRNDSVVLPTPFKTVTAVTVNGVAIDASSYEITDYGLVFNTGRFRDFDGFPTGDSLRRGLRVARGGVVKVTATFGYDTPPPIVKRATVALTCALAQQNAGSAPDPNVKSLKVEGYSVTYRNPEDQASPSETTGNADVDRWLHPYHPGGGDVI